MNDMYVGQSPMERGEHDVGQGESVHPVDAVWEALNKVSCPGVYMKIAAEAVATALAHPAAAFDFVSHLQRQREWSGRTFGPGSRAQGVVDHIRKELTEIEADPGDLKEWIDVVILALDGAWRSGAQPHEIVQALVAKQTKNEGRVWPDWRTADPNKAIEHDRSHDRPVAEQLETFYVHHNGASWFVKGADFFALQGGHAEAWGKGWKPIRATSIEDARERAQRGEVKS